MLSDLGHIIYLHMKQMSHENYYLHMCNYPGKRRYTYWLYSRLSATTKNHKRPHAIVIDLLLVSCNLRRCSDAAITSSCHIHEPCRETMEAWEASSRGDRLHRVNLLQSYVCMSPRQRAVALNGAKPAMRFIPQKLISVVLQNYR